MLYSCIGGGENKRQRVVKPTADVADLPHPLCDITEGHFQDDESLLANLPGEAQLDF